MKTPEELASEYGNTIHKDQDGFDLDDCRWSHITEWEKRAFLAGYAAAQPKWISVKERLPEDGQTVIYLITVETAFGLKWKIDYGKWNFKEQIFFGEFFDYRELGRGVKYWMPLPLPPKENE